MWSRPRRVRLLLAGLLLSGALAGCGWHLRGAMDAQLPPELATPYLQGAPLESALGSIVYRNMEQLGSSVVRSQSEASGVLALHDRLERRVVSLARNGTVDEYELHYSLTFSVRRPGGQVLLGPETVDLYRTYSYDPAQVLAKGNEEAQLRDEMMNAAVAQMLRRIAIGLPH